MEMNLPAEILIVFELDKNLKSIKPVKFLEDKETMCKPWKQRLPRARPRNEDYQSAYYPHHPFLCTSPQHLLY